MNNPLTYFKFCAVCKRIHNFASYPVKAIAKCEKHGEHHTFYGIKDDVQCCKCAEENNICQKCGKPLDRE